MTKIEELEQKINECQKALAELKESKKEGKWKPQIGEKYWFRSTDNFIGWLINNCQSDEWRINNLPIFPTKEACERYYRFMDTVKEKSYEFSELDWKNNKVIKFWIDRDCTTNIFYVTKSFIGKGVGTIHFKSVEDAQYIIDNFKDELMEYWL